VDEEETADTDMEPLSGRDCLRAFRDNALSAFRKEMFRGWMMFLVQPWLRALRCSICLCCRWFHGGEVAAGIMRGVLLGGNGRRGTRAIASGGIEAVGGV